MLKLNVSFLGSWVCVRVFVGESAHLLQYFHNLPLYAGDATNGTNHNASSAVVTNIVTVAAVALETEKEVTGIGIGIIIYKISLLGSSRHHNISHPKYGRRVYWYDRMEDTLALVGLAVPRGSSINAGPGSANRRLFLFRPIQLGGPAGISSTTVDIRW